MLRKRMQGLLAVFLREPVFLFWVGLFALLVRLEYNVLYVGPGYVPTSDAADYSGIAANLAAGSGFRLQDGTLTASRLPLFPLLLAVIYRLVGLNYQAGLTMQAVLGVGIVIACYALGKKVHSAAAGRIAALIAAVYPMLIYEGGSLLSEPLFVLLVVLAVLVGLRQLEQPSTGSSITLGCLLGLAWLTRPSGPFLIASLLGWLAIAGCGTWRQKLIGVAIVLLVTVIVIVPWIVRNYLQLGGFVPVFTTGGTSLLGAYNEEVLKDPAQFGWINPCIVPGIRGTCGLPEIERNAVQQRLAIDFVRTHLRDLPRLMWWRFRVFWHLYPFRHGFPENVGFYAYVLVASLAVLGVWFSRAKWRVLGVLLSVVAASLVGSLLVSADFRYRAPVEPLMIVLASVALIEGLGYLQWTRCAVGVQNI